MLTTDGQSIVSFLTMILLFVSHAFRETEFGKGAAFAAFALSSMRIVYLVYTARKRKLLLAESQRRLDEINLRIRRLRDYLRATEPVVRVNEISCAA